MYLPSSGLCSWNLKTANPFFVCPHVANAITTSTMGISHRSVTDCRIGIIRLTVTVFSAGTNANRPTPLQEFLIFSGVCHLKLSFTEEEELPTLSYQEPRIKHGDAFIFSGETKPPKKQDGTGQLQITGAPLPSPSRCWERPLVTKGVPVQQGHGARLHRFSPCLRCRKTQRASSIS